MGTVCIKKIKNRIKPALSEVLDSLGGIKKLFTPHDRILLKPNLNDDTCFTDPGLTEALIQLLLDHQIRNLALGESTFGNAGTTDRYFQETGYFKLADMYNIPLLNFNRSRPTSIMVPDPRVTGKIKVAREILEADKIINLPVMKVHYATGISLALKNMKGLLVGDEKKRFHTVGLDQAIIDLNSVIRPALNIIDCIRCMEKMGPKGGEIKKLDLIIAGTSSAEVDYIGSRIMGYRLTEVKHLSQYLKLHKINLNQIKIMGETLADCISPFKKAIIDQKKIKNISIQNKSACSSCMNALLLSLKLIDEKLNTKIDIFLGSANHRGVIQTRNPQIAFGNCCQYPGAAAIIKGCPPYPLELKKVLKELKNKNRI